MGHIGNTAQTAFTSFDKQTITGTGGTTYTLTHSVANEREIEVFVNNVRQEPSVAYTVSGNTLTMTGNVASTDDFYVVYQGKAIQTASHPSTSPLQATTGTFSSNVDVGGSLLVDTIKEGTGTTTAMTIDSSGRILTPARPAFNVSWSADQTASATGFARLNFDVENFDIGSNVSGAVFTAPVSGVYHFDLSQRFDGIGSGYVNISFGDDASTMNASAAIYKVGYRIRGTPDTNYVSLESSVTWQLASGDVVAPWYYVSADTSYTLKLIGGHFSGYLVG